MVDPSEAEIERFENFANKNWGEGRLEGGNNTDFFDLHRIIFTLEDDGELLSGLVVMFKVAILSGKAVCIGGIGGVVTGLTVRRKGYAIKVLNECVKYLREMKVDIVMLCTEIEKLGGLYGKAGFSPLMKSYYFLDRNNVKKAETGGMYLLLSDKISKAEIEAKNKDLFVGRSNF